MRSNGFSIALAASSAFGVLVVIAAGLGFLRFVQVKHDSQAPQARYEPSPDLVVDKMLAMAQIRAGDRVFDLGCGDGRVVIAAVQLRGVKGVCVEFDSKVIQKARDNAAAAGVADQIIFVEGDLFAVDLSTATVVTLFLTPVLNERLLPKLRAELRPGTRIISHWHVIPGWPAEQTETVTAFGRSRPIYRWTVR